VHIETARAEPETEWEVFEADGAYLGRVRGPRLAPAPIVFRGNDVWAVVRDTNDVPLLTRYRVTPPFPDR
jgi:hypothetical protein